MGSDGEQAQTDRLLFTLRWRGYERTQVERWVTGLAGRSSPGERPQFTIVLRGYDRDEVDRFVDAHPADGPAPCVPGDQGSDIPEFTIVLRGYERHEVDSYVARAQARIADLEHQVRQLRSVPPA